MENMLRIVDFDNFFTTYKNVNPEHFSDLFGENVEDEEIATLDEYLTFVFGDRIIKKSLRQSFEKDGKETAVEKAVKECDLRNFESWKATKNYIAETYDSSVVYPNKATNTRVTEREGEENGTTQNKENAFDNIQTASNTDSSESNGSHSETITVTETKQQGNQKTVYTNASEAINFARNNDFIEIVMYDIAENISLAIF